MPSPAYTLPSPTSPTSPAYSLPSPAKAYYIQDTREYIPISPTRLQPEPESLVTLKARLKDDSVDVGSFGDLHLVDTLMIRRSSQDVMSLYLFDDALLCVKPVKKKLFKRASTDLKLCGRILVKDMKRVYDSSTSKEHALTVDIEQGSFDIIFESKFMLEMWSKSLDMVIEAGGVRQTFHKSLASSSLPSLTTDPSRTSASSSERSPAVTSNTFYHGIPQGHETVLSGSTGPVKTYITTPSDRVARYYSQRKKTAVILISDVSGFELNSLRLTADAIAAAGFLVFIPDILHGDGVQFDHPNAWAQAAEIIKRHKPETIAETIHAVVDVVRFKVQVDNIVLIGYGYGAQYAILSNATSQCQASAVINPTSIAIDEFYFKTTERPLLAIVSPENESAEWVMRFRKQVSIVNPNFQFFSFSGTSRRFSLHPISHEDESAGYFAVEDTIRFLESVSRMAA